MKLQDIMTAGIVTVRSTDTARRAAELMRDCGVKVLAVVDAGRIVGTLTERNIIVQSTAVGQSPDDALAGEIMCRDLLIGYGYDDASCVQKILAATGSQALIVLDAKGDHIGLIHADAVQIGGLDTRRLPSPPPETAAAPPAGQGYWRSSPPRH